MIKHITSEKELEEMINQGNVLLDFFATWCGPCRMIAPILEELDEEGFNVQIVKVDVDEAEELAYKFGIQAVPTLIFIKNGEISNRHSGFMRKDEIKSFCNL